MAKWYEDLMEKWYEDRNYGIGVDPDTGEELPDLYEGYTAEVEEELDDCMSASARWPDWPLFLGDIPRFSNGFIQSEHLRHLAKRNHAPKGFSPVLESEEEVLRPHFSERIGYCLEDFEDWLNEWLEGDWLTVDCEDNCRKINVLKQAWPSVIVWEQDAEMASAGLLKREHLRNLRAYRLAFHGDFYGTNIDPEAFPIEVFFEDLKDWIKGGKKMDTNLIENLKKAWPYDVVFRKDCEMASQGAIKRKHLANLDSEGKGPEGRVLFGNKVGYPTEAFFSWLKTRIQ